jgi:hypothetical protein
LIDDVDNIYHIDVLKHIDDLNRKYPKRLSFSGVPYINRHLALDIAELIQDEVPLKFMVMNTSSYALHKAFTYHFRDCEDIEVVSGQVNFRFDYKELYRFLQYTYNPYDAKILVSFMYQKFDVLTADYIWHYVIEHEWLFELLNIPFSAKRAQFIRQNYISDYMLNEAFNASNLTNVLHVVKKELELSFELELIDPNRYKYDYNYEDKPYYKINITKYIGKLLEIESYEYVLPLDGWKIFADYFSKFKKRTLYDYDNYTGSVSNINITDVLFDILNKQYGVRIISSELINI